MKKLSLWSIAAVLLLTVTHANAQTLTKEERQARLQKAEVLFKEHCKASGEFIKRTVDDVEGIYLLKLRPFGINRGSQFEMDDPYGNDVGGDGYIEIFLFGKTKDGSISSKNSVSQGYRYVEAIDLQDGKRYRYTGSIKEVTHTSSILMGGDGKTTFKSKEFVLDKVSAPGAAPRYGVTYDDISTQEDRELWIAGSSLKVIDLKTNEVIAERIGYMMDRGQGSRAGARSPWLMAEHNACPSFPMAPGNHPFKMYQTRNFVERVLHTKQGE